MSIHSVKIQFTLTDEQLKSLAMNATSLFFKAGLPVEEDTVTATRSEGANCVNIQATPRRTIGAISLSSFRDVLTLFNPRDHAIYEKSTGKITLMCVEIYRLGAETEAV